MRKSKDMPYHIGVRIKLYLSDRQKHIVAVNDGVRRSVYNHLVSVNRDIHRLSKTADLVPCDRERIIYLRSVAEKPGMKAALPYLAGKDVDSAAVDNAFRNYRIAWKNMREHKRGVPTFRRKSHEQRYQTNCHYRSGDTGLDDGSIRFTDRNHIRLPKLGRTRFAGSPKIMRMLSGHVKETRIGNVTVSRDAVGEYWCSLSLSSEYPFKKALAKTGKQVGIDLNLLELAVGSDGSSFENKRFRKRNEKKLARQQRILSRRAECARSEGRSLRESRNYQKQRRKVALLNRKIARQRRDHLNCISRHLVENQDLIAMEDLRVSNLMKNHRLAGAISDAGWRTLITMVQQKAQMYGKEIRLVPPHYTSRTCSDCGYVMPAMPLSVRGWTCPDCGEYHDRDMNAGANILNKALSMAAR